jgi:hypothetical protein
VATVVFPTPECVPATTTRGPRRGIAENDTDAAAGCQPSIPEADYEQVGSILCL